MAEYIERETLLKHSTLIPGYIGEYVAADRIKEAPAADVAPVRHGWWTTTDTLIGQCCVCSICGSCPTMEYRYCPYCGSLMDGGADNG